MLARAPCALPIDSYAAYRERAVATYGEESAAAARAGLSMRSRADFEAALLSEAEWTPRARLEGIRCERIEYSSDGLRVVAYLWRPAAATSAKLPLVLFARGGLGEASKLRPNTQFGFARFVAAGYAVLGTQYRGNDGGEGTESLGEGDVRDLLNLVPLARNLGDLDTERAYLLGYSRGGMVAALALARGLEVRAAATVGGLFDATALAAERPEFRARFASAPDVDVALRERSAVAWPDRLRVPLLLLHGGADASANPASQSLALAGALQREGRRYELVLYEGDTHGIAIAAADRDRRIVDWFARHGR